MKAVLLALLLVLSLGTPVRAAETAADLANATVVIYNRVDPASVRLARFYAQQRGIPNDHLIALQCPTEEEISRKEYDETIAQPLRNIFVERKWWTLRKPDEDQPSVSATKINFVALIRGMPLKIRATVDYPGDQPADGPIGSENKASVDSELSVLGLFSRHISGPNTNPYFQNFRSIREAGVVPLLLVCRLDGPSEEVVRRMISDAVETEKRGLWGRAYVDAGAHSDPGMRSGDEWLEKIVQDVRQAGIPVVYDRSAAIFPAGFPMSDCALYFGWYAGSVAGVFTDPDFAFARGAIAVHIHSFSASTLRDVNANWVAPLLSKGAAASLGNVYEPFLQLTAHLDIFNDRLLHGFTFGESAYMALPALSWMNVSIGDPLYRPYGSWLQISLKRDSGRKSDWRMYHDFAVDNASKDPAEYRRLARQTAVHSGNAPMLEDLGLQELEAEHFDQAVSDLQQARSLYKKRDDILRTVLEQADALIRTGKQKRALTLVRSVLAIVPDAPAARLLREVEQKLSPTPTPTP